MNRNGKAGREGDNGVCPVNMVRVLVAYLATTSRYSHILTYFPLFKTGWDRRARQA